MWSFETKIGHGQHSKLNNEHKWEDLYDHLKNKGLFALVSYK